MSGSRGARLAAPAILVALLAAAGASGAVAIPSAATVVRDKQADTRALRRKPELDIRRVAAEEVGADRVRFKITMQGRLRPARKFTRPFILVNTRGDRRSAYEYLALGPRVFKRIGKERYRKVGANRFEAKRRTWVYSFRPSRVGAGPGETFGWAVLTTKGRTSDLAPNRRYRSFEVDGS